MRPCASVRDARDGKSESPAGSGAFNKQNKETCPGYPHFAVTQAGPQHLNGRATHLPPTQRIGWHQPVASQLPWQYEASVQALAAAFAFFAAKDGWDASASDNAASAAIVRYFMDSPIAVSRECGMRSGRFVGTNSHHGHSCDVASMQRRSTMEENRRGMNGA
jgi:hypothetical protein